MLHKVTIMAIAGAIFAANVSAEPIENLEEKMQTARGVARDAIETGHSQGLDVPILTQARSVSRVVGGEAALTPGLYEFTASLQFDGEHFCGGAFVSPRIRGERIVSWRSRATSDLWVLTAAHCTYFPNREEMSNLQITVLGGQRDFSEADRGAYSFPVEEIIRHPGFEQGDGFMANDVALLKLGPRVDPAQGEAEFEPESIQLPSPAMVQFLYQPYTRQVLNGWGRTQEGGRISPVLLSAVVPVVARELCQKHLDTVGGTLASSSFCAGWASGGVDSCNGDSGGPLYFDTGRGGIALSYDPILTGVVSWGVGCALAGYEGVYVNLPAVRRWIDDTVIRHSQG